MWVYRSFPAMQGCIRDQRRAPQTTFAICLTLVMSRVCFCSRGNDRPLPLRIFSQTIVK